MSQIENDSSAKIHLNKDTAVDDISDLMMMGFHETPFHKTLGMSFEVMPDLSVKGYFNKQQSLMGNVARGMLHGGALSAVFDSMGGVTCAINVKEKYKDLPLPERAKKLGRICTIDLKVDYLAPAKAEEFVATGTVVKLGKSVIVVRMELEAEGKLIALGQGNFMY